VREGSFVSDRAWRHASLAKKLTLRQLCSTTRREKSRSQPRCRRRPASRRGSD